MRDETRRVLEYWLDESRRKLEHWLNDRDRCLAELTKIETQIERVQAEVAALEADLDR